MSEIEEEEYLPEPYIPDQMAGPDDFGDFHDARYGNVSAFSRPSISYINESGLPDDVIDRHFQRRGLPKEVASIIEKWSQSLANSSGAQTIDVFNRNKWENKNHQFAIMSQCAWSVDNDDILSTTADVIEGLLWQGCHFEGYDEDQVDKWNQWAADVDLDSTFRKVGRELFKVSQVYVGISWVEKIYKVRNDDVERVIDDFEQKRRERQNKLKAGEKDQEGNDVDPIPDLEIGGKGNRNRKKQFPVLIPGGFTIFDPTKIMPVGQLMFGKERFAYIANDDEQKAFKAIVSGEAAPDPMVRQMIESKYDPSPTDKAACADVGVDHNNLWLMRENTIFRHTLTRADYERWAPVRLKSAIPILEMKQHLRAADRATLIGNTNFIVLITKGTDKLPAKPAEIENLQAQAKVIARLPVLVGDHRLDVKIVSPPTDNTLIESRYQVLDSRLVFMALRSYSPVVQGGNSSGTGISEMSRIVSKGLESRRHMIVRSFESAVFEKIMLANEGVLDESPSLAFTPKRITLDLSNEVVQAMLKLRDRGDISRETMLEEVDFDQDVEVLRRAREKALYDDVFTSSVPFSSPGTNPFQQPGGAAPGGPSSGPPNSNVGPAGQPRTEGGRPAGAKTAKRKQDAADADE